MLLGKSILHVNQGVGKTYSKTEISGYYNDLTGKVLKDKKYFNTLEIPKVKIQSGEEIYFPIAVFQYGLGAYDLYLLEKKELYLRKFFITAEWAIENQNSNGAWKNFFLFTQKIHIHLWHRAKAHHFLYAHTKNSKMLSI